MRQIALALILLSACHRRSGVDDGPVVTPEVQLKQPTASPPLIKHTLPILPIPTREQRPTPAQPVGSCQADSDCVISCVPTERCCDQLCFCSIAYSRDALEKQLSWRDRSCKADGRCPIAKCRVPAISYKALCQGGRCVTQETPILSE